MANFYPSELAAARSGSTPQQQPDSALVGAKARRTRASFTLNSQAIGDTLVLGELPIGAVITSIVLTSSVSLGTATLAVGNATTPAKYRAAGTFTAVDTPTPVGPGAVAKAAAPATAPETVIATIAAAALPASGTLVADIHYTTRA